MVSVVFLNREFGTCYRTETMIGCKLREPRGGKWKEVLLGGINQAIEQST